MARALGGAQGPILSQWLVTHRTQSDRNTLTLVYLAAEQTAVLFTWDTFDLLCWCAHLPLSIKTRVSLQAATAPQFHPEVTVWGLERWFHYRVQK